MRKKQAMVGICAILCSSLIGDKVYSESFYRLNSNKEECVSLWELFPNNISNKELEKAFGTKFVYKLGVGGITYFPSKNSSSINIKYSQKVRLNKEGRVELCGKNYYVLK